MEVMNDLFETVVREMVMKVIRGIVYIDVLTYQNEVKSGIEVNHFDLIFEDVEEDRVVIFCLVSIYDQVDIACEVSGYLVN